MNIDSLFSQIRQLNRLATSLLVSFLILPLSTLVQAQQSNPLANDPRAAGAGGVIFRAQCATCHGADAKGISSIDAPDLTLMWIEDGISDSSVFQTISSGVPGSIMPAHGFPDAEIWMLVSYLRSVAVGGSLQPFTGNAERGERLFASNCSECHRVEREGGILGPNLTGITARRTQESIASSVRSPNASIARRYKPVSFVSAGNRRTEGVIKSEDAFSLQIMDSNQQLRAFTKSELSQLNRNTDSLMPAFSAAALSSSELDNILSFLNQSR